MLLALFGAFGESHSIISSLPIYYTMFSIPHWIWAGISAYFEASKKTTIGGFSGLNALFLAIGIFSILQEKSPDSANIWFLYYFASPILIAIGAYIGAAINSKRAGAA
ncbi:hypothetical protein [Atopomonas sediminilitoris]|uniref:hypothetical protein n=1 Tax=Atopomonas sediminilitoris TaxID=2919919 RepID=UPI001F4ED824|nr:hypothetical protein [Atopomonas sediminilitoris]MCJ8169299.1 hypothetical protein [Atopomonas sediminilitoris]